MGIKNLELSNCDETIFIKRNGQVEKFTPDLKNNLFVKLRNWRLGQAQKLGLPAYCILENYVLIDIVNILPVDLPMLWLISGVREARINAYGNDIVRIVNDFLNGLQVVKVLYGKKGITISKKNRPILGFMELLDYFEQTEEDELDLYEDIVPYNRVEKKTNFSSKYNSNLYQTIKAGDTVTIEIENNTYIFKIVQSVTINKPIWTGVRGKRCGTEAETISTADPTNDNTISSKSPLALAIIGKRTGESFSYKVENNVFKGKIIAIN